MTRTPLPVKVLLLAATIVAAMPACAQTPTYYVVTPGGFNMRLASLGDASCSEALDVSAMFGNPASLNHLREPGVIATHVMNRVTGGQTEQVALAVLSHSWLAVAVNGSYTHGGSVRPEGVSPFPLKEYGGDLALSMSISPILSVGAIGGVRRTDLALLPTTSGWLQAGLFYYPSPGISYGITYRVRNGAVYWFANGQNGVDEHAPFQQGVELGATMTYPSRSDRPVATLSLTTEKFFPGISLFSTKGGLEVLPVRFLALRMGFKVGSFERVARYGIGIVVDPVRLDVAVGPSRSDHRFAGLSLSVRL